MKDILFTGTLRRGDEDPVPVSGTCRAEVGPKLIGTLKGEIPPAWQTEDKGDVRLDLTGGVESLAQQLRLPSAPAFVVRLHGFGIHGDAVGFETAGPPIRD